MKRILLTSIFFIVLGAGEALALEPVYNSLEMEATNCQKELLYKTALCPGTLAVPSEAPAGTYDRVLCQSGKICKNENSVCSMFGQVCDTQRASSGGGNPCQCVCTSRPD